MSLLMSMSALTFRSINKCKPLMAFRLLDLSSVPVSTPANANAQFRMSSSSSWNFQSIGISLWSIYQRARSYTSGGKMHSEKCVVESPTLKIIGIPALSDNYMYLIIEKPSLQAVVVDPVEPDNVMKEIRNENVTLTGILTTHHHWDHAGGNEDMVKKYKNEETDSNLEVYGGDDRIGALTKKVGQGDIIPFGGFKFVCHFTPCHTSGHICYFLESPDPSNQKSAVFTGDTLFIAGCGRFFEGTAEQMHAAFINKLGQLPLDTMVFCGHEYTIGNLKFALDVEPNNAVMKNKLTWAEDQRTKLLPTIPSTIGEEKEINPFMRCVLPEIQQIVQTESAVECMGKLRKMKDNFKAK